MVSENDLKYDRLLTSVQAKKYRVMIVDDEQDITTIFKMGLENNPDGIGAMFAFSLPIVG